MGESGPRILVGICIVLLAMVQLLFFVAYFRDSLAADYRRSLTPTTYAMLTFGLLGLLIAVYSLPQLLKLNVAGFALEKTAVEKGAGPASLELTREPGLAGIIASKVPAIPLPTDQTPPSSSPREASSRATRQTFEEPSMSGAAPADQRRQGAEQASARED